MDTKPVNRKILSRLFYAYLKCLEKTAHVKWEGMESFNGNQVVGFWHEDSFAMNLLLREVTETDNKMSVLVTGDPRGDYIQYMIEKCREMRCASATVSVIPEHFGSFLQV